MRHEKNKQTLLIMGSVIIAILVLVKLFGVSAFIFLVVLCPIMMIAMMLGMNHKHK